MTTSRQLIMFFVLVLFAAPRAWAANEATFTFTRPTNTTTTNVELEFERNGSLERVTVPIEPGSAGAKRNAIKSALEANHFDVADVGLTGLRIEGLRAGTKVTFKPGDTGEDRDTQTAMALPGGNVGFANTLFSPLDATGQPAFFTAGIITDAGELTARVSAQELGLTSGAIICQALFQRLAPQAPAFGAHVNYMGDSLSFTFNPALAQGEVGIVYGTTSLTPGIYGSTPVVPEPATCAFLMLAPAMLLRRRPCAIERC
jgi:hypothetical protein